MQENNIIHGKFAHFSLQSGLSQNLLFAKIEMAYWIICKIYVLACFRGSSFGKSGSCEN